MLSIRPDWLPWPDITMFDSFAGFQTPAQFAVDSSSGVITSYQKFDYDESPNEYPLTLTATDKGHPPLTG